MQMSSNEQKVCTVYTPAQCEVSERTKLHKGHQLIRSIDNCHHSRLVSFIRIWTHKSIRIMPRNENSRNHLVRSVTLKDITEMPRKMFEKVTFTNAKLFISSHLFSHFVMLETYSLAMAADLHCNMLRCRGNHRAQYNHHHRKFTCKNTLLHGMLYSASSEDSRCNLSQKWRCITSITAMSMIVIDIWWAIQ